MGGGGPAARVKNWLSGACRACRGPVNLTGCSISFQLKVMDLFLELNCNSWKKGEGAVLKKMEQLKQGLETQRVLG